MKKISVLAGLVLAIVVTTVPSQSVAQQQQAGSADVVSGAAMPVEQLIPMTVHEAWVASGRNEDKFFAMVQQLAELSAQKRGVTLPDDAGAGRRAGAKFKEIARRDPGQLLYVVVDRMVQHVAMKQQAAGSATQ